MENSDYKKRLIERATKFAKEIIVLVDKFPTKRSAWIIADQLIRAATSIGANIIEAQAASSRKDFTNFLNHSLKSGNETRYWLILAKDLDVKLSEEINALIKETTELTNMLGSSIIKLKNY